MGYQSRLKSLKVFYLLNDLANSKSARLHGRSKPAKLRGQRICRGWGLSENLETLTVCSQFSKSSFSACTVKFYMQRYRSGYNENDSKSFDGWSRPWVRIPPAAPNIPPTLDAMRRKAHGIGLPGLFEPRNFIGQTKDIKVDFLATGGIRTPNIGNSKRALPQMRANSKRALP